MRYGFSHLDWQSYPEIWLQNCAAGCRLLSTRPKKTWNGV